MTISFNLCNVWIGSGGVFPFTQGTIQNSDNITAGQVFTLLSSLKTSCEAIALTAFPADAVARVQYGSDLFEWLVEHSSVQTRNGLIMYIMPASVNGTISFDGTTFNFRNSSGKVTNVLSEYAAAVVYAMQASNALGAGYGPALFRSLLSKIQVS